MLISFETFDQIYSNSLQSANKSQPIDSFQCNFIRFVAIRFLGMFEKKSPCKTRIENYRITNNKYRKWNNNNNKLHYGANIQMKKETLP